MLSRSDLLLLFSKFNLLVFYSFKCTSRTEEFASKFDFFQENFHASRPLPLLFSNVADNEHGKGYMEK